MVLHADAVLAFVVVESDRLVFHLNNTFAIACRANTVIYIIGAAVVSEKASFSLADRAIDEARHMHYPMGKAVVDFQVRPDWMSRTVHSLTPNL